MEQDAIIYAAEKHAGQTYGDIPYVFHLVQVAQVLLDFGFNSDLYQDAAYLHDVVEDTDATVADIHMVFGPEVAQLVNAVTGEGENRRERQANILQKIRAYPAAAVLKLADRIANVESRGKLDMYRKEHEAFSEVIKPHVPEAMYERYLTALGEGLLA